MWSTRLFLLGLVRWLQPVHGYEVRRELMSWGVQEYTQLKPGSIYHGLKKLASDGLLEVAASEPIPRRPARTSYRITVAGESEFQKLLRTKLWGWELPRDPFAMAWGFMPALSEYEAAAMLHNRAALMRDMRERVEARLRDRDAPPDSPNYLPPHVRALCELHLDQLDVSAKWCDRTAEAVERREIPVGDLQAAPAAARRWRENIARMDDPDGADRRA